MSVYVNKPATRAAALEEQRQRVRARYRGVENKEDIVVLPCIEEPGFYNDQRSKKVAVYARVSTDSIQQTTSYELQRNYYERTIQQHPNWEMVGIYADEGISGTSLKHRDNFIRMIDDCKAGKIDMILVKSVSRFSRNVVDCITEVRALAALKKPVGVFFESEGIYTLDDEAEMRLPMIATMAQEESHTKSRIMNTSYEMRFSQGIFLTPPLLGYDNDENSHLIINPEEARTVKLIFFLYLYGYSTGQIADALMKLQRLTKKGNTKWTASTVLAVLQNERHCGDVLARKTWTPSYLDHKSKKNNMNRNQYLYHDDHEAIISRNDFIAVQHLIANAKYGYHGLLPHLHVIESGALKGFVAINTKWASFTAEDYLEAAETCTAETETENVCMTERRANPGDFDFRNFVVARSQFIQSQSEISATFSGSTIQFSKGCISKLDNTQRVELLFDPVHRIFAVRASGADNKHSVLWMKPSDQSIVPRAVSGTAFLPTFFSMLDWKEGLRYRVRGVRRQKDNETVLLFNLMDFEAIIPINGNDRVFDENTQPVSCHSHSSVIAYPAEWADTFGTAVYAHELTPELLPIDQQNLWDVTAPGTPVEGRINVATTERSEIKKGIDDLLVSMKKEAAANG